MTRGRLEALLRVTGPIIPEAMEECVEDLETAEKELDPLEQALCDFVDCLAPGGRICVITFHSLEDRIVKRTFKTLENPCICPPKAPICTCGRKPSVKVLGGGAIAPSGEETARNPRARSAKLRIAEKLDRKG